MGADAAHHDDHGHEDHGHDDHDAHAHHGGPDIYIVQPSSEPVAESSNTAMAYVAFLALLVLLAVIVKLVG